MHLPGYIIAITFLSVTASALRKNIAIVNLEASRYQRGSDKAHNLIKAELRSGTTIDTCMVDWLATEGPYDYFVCSQRALRIPCDRSYF